MIGGMTLRNFSMGLLALLCAALGALHHGSHLWAAQAATPASGSPPSIVLLGEVHDNAAQHAMRLETFKALLAGGARPALLMEQFDREHQAAIDRARAASPRPDADAVIAAGSGSPRWNWAFYKPFVELALAHDLPLVAANVSRKDAQQVMVQGLEKSGFDARVPADIERAHTADIESSHCGLIGEAQARVMASAQVARDQFMARMVESYASRGVVLLAGNGHVRNDVGVPRWLSAATKARSTVLGFLEEGGAPPGAYDRVYQTPPQPREDPCAAMRKAPPLST
jgi:uncharacterized iron-regulated protein